MAKPKRKLGRGLDALLNTQPGKPAPHQGAAPSQPTAGAVLELDPHAIEANPQQPRKEFREEALEELAQSIRRHGLQEPIIVRKHGETYQLVSGERRVRASIMADQETIPAVVREVSDDDMLLIGLIENIQREDLNAIELAASYQRLIDTFGWTQENLAEQVGKKRATVANILRLLHLPVSVQEALNQEQITMGHARALLAIEGEQAQAAACRQVIAKGLSVRQTEQLAKPKPPRAPKPAKDPNLASVEDDLRRKLGTKVHLKNGPKNRGKIEIEYYSLDDLERLLDLLKSAR